MYCGELVSKDTKPNVNALLMEEKLGFFLQCSTTEVFSKCNNTKFLMDKVTTLKKKFLFPIPDFHIIKPSEQKKKTLSYNHAIVTYIHYSWKNEICEQRMKMQLQIESTENKK